MSDNFIRDQFHKDVETLNETLDHIKGMTDELIKDAVIPPVVKRDPVSERYYVVPGEPASFGCPLFYFWGVA